MILFYGFEWGDSMCQDTEISPVDGAVYVFATEKDREEWCKKMPNRKAIGASAARKFIAGPDEAYQEWLEDMKTGFRIMAAAALGGFQGEKTVVRSIKMHKHFYEGVRDGLITLSSTD